MKKYRNETEGIYERTQMQKQVILQRLRERGCRVTKQRLVILDTILKEECTCCKDIYAIASKKDAGIGVATVYRMINILEEVGAISRKNMYKVCCESEDCRFKKTCRVELDDDTVIELSEKKLNHVVKAGLMACGYVKGQDVKLVEKH